MTHEEKRARREKIRETVASGVSPVEASRRFGVSLSSVYHCAGGVGKNPRGGRTTILQILKDAFDGVPAKETAKSIGASPQYVYFVIAEARKIGIPIPDSRV